MVKGLEGKKGLGSSKTLFWAKLCNYIVLVLGTLVNTVPSNKHCSNFHSWTNLALPYITILSFVFPYIARLAPATELYLAFKADSTVSYTCFLPSLAPLKINAPPLFWAT